MCGILIQFSATQNADTSLFKKSLDIMSHRGPDGSGIVFEKEDTYLFKQQDNVTGYSRILLGHRRLSIIDLATGSQPMVDSTGNYALTFNGEIFNYKQLHADLLNKYNIQFKTTSDSEVLLYGLIKEGASFLNKCNGMWAFGFYSIKDKELFISRDRYGIKPLYYMQIGASIIASSEIKPLLQFTKSSINNSITDFYIKTGISDFSDETFFNNIKQLHPGHNLTVCSKGDTVHLDISQWYDIYKKKYEYTDTQDCESAYRDLINDSVKLRLESDVEVGALLSGGIDSSIVVGVAANFFNQSKIKTFSGISENKNYDESFWIDAVVKKHQHIINTKTNLESEISAGEIDEVILTQESP
jgi:asparagine synthase (glutamine-hydrolysing)